MDNKMGLMWYARIETPGADAIAQYQAIPSIDKTARTKPRFHFQFAGGVNFGSCEVYKDVLDDPYMPIRFGSEEYAQLETHGYEMYAPSVDVVFHSSQERKKIWDDDWSTRSGIMEHSKRRVRDILGLPRSSEVSDMVERDKHGLDTKRTFAQWQKFSRIDPLANSTREIRLQFHNCGELTLVPYLRDNEQKSAP